MTRASLFLTLAAAGALGVGLLHGCGDDGNGSNSTGGSGGSTTTGGSSGTTGGSSGTTGGSSGATGGAGGRAGTGGSGGAAAGGSGGQAGRGGFMIPDGGFTIPDANLDFDALFGSMCPADPQGKACTLAAPTCRTGDTSCLCLGQTWMCSGPQEAGAPMDCPANAAGTPCTTALGTCTLTRADGGIGGCLCLGAQGAAPTWRCF